MLDFIGHNYILGGIITFIVCAIVSFIFARYKGGDYEEAIAIITLGFSTMCCLFWPLAVILGVLGGVYGVLAWGVIWFNDYLNTEAEVKRQVAQAIKDKEDDAKRKASVLARVESEKAASVARLKSTLVGGPYGTSFISNKDIEDVAHSRYLGNPFQFPPAKLYGVPTQITYSNEMQALNKALANITKIDPVYKDDDRDDLRNINPPARFSFLFKKSTMYLGIIDKFIKENVSVGDKNNLYVLQASLLALKAALIKYPDINPKDFQALDELFYDVENKLKIIKDNIQTELSQNIDKEKSLIGKMYLK